MFIGNILPTYIFHYIRPLWQRHHKHVALSTLRYDCVDFMLENISYKHEYTGPEDSARRMLSFYWTAIIAVEWKFYSKQETSWFPPPHTSGSENPYVANSYMFCGMCVFNDICMQYWVVFILPPKMHMHLIITWKLLNGINHLLERNIPGPVSTWKPYFQVWDSNRKDKTVVRR